MINHEKKAKKDAYSLTSAEKPSQKEISLVNSYFKTKSLVL